MRSLASSSKMSWGFGLRLRETKSHGSRIRMGTRCQSRSTSSSLVISDTQLTSLTRCKLVSLLQEKSALLTRFTRSGAPISTSPTDRIILRWNSARDGWLRHSGSSASQTDDALCVPDGSGVVNLKVCDIHLRKAQRCSFPGIPGMALRTPDTSFSCCGL